MRYRKTYGAKGLLEFRMTLRAGTAKVRINFTDGSMGSNGVVSAKYVTDNAAIQQLIEGSAHFRRGKVFLYGKPIKISDGPAATQSQTLSNGPAPDMPAGFDRQTVTTHESENRRPCQESCPDDGGDTASYEC